MSDPRRSLDDLLLYRLSRLLSVAGSMVIRLCEGRFGITRREWRLIATLASRGELGSSQLAEHAQLDRARTSKAVSSLVEKGLLSRTHPAGDRRQVLLQLTERGQAAVRRAVPAGDAHQRRPAGRTGRQAMRRSLDEALRQLQARAEQLAGEAVLPKADRGRRGAG